MRFDEMDQELVERAKECKTTDERMAFVAENGIELTDEQLESIAGGKRNGGAKLKRECPGSSDGDHHYVWTGRTRPGEYWKDLWPDYEGRCKVCGHTDWFWFK